MLGDNSFETIRPRRFHPLEAHKDRSWFSALRGLPWAAVATTALLGTVVLACVWFLFSARIVRLDMEPEDAQLEVNAILAIRLGGILLAMPGDYLVSLQRAGYGPMEGISMQIGPERNQNWSFQLAKLPGQVHFASDPGGAEVVLAGEILGRTPLQAAIVAGEQEFLFRLPRYKTESLVLGIVGMGQTQDVQVQLLPDWAFVQIESTPAGALVMHAERELGRTPGTFEILSGTQEIEVRLPGHKIWRQTINTEAGEQLRIAPIQLQKSDGIVTINSQPAGANVLVNDRFAGQTPLSLPLPPGKQHSLGLIKAGYEEYLSGLDLAPGEERSLNVTLKAKVGDIEIRIVPRNADVYVDGERIGKGDQSLRLTATKHIIEARLQGYADWRKIVEPQEGLTQRFDILMETVEEFARAAIPNRFRTAEGQEMILIRLPPIMVEMGSSRREDGYQQNQAKYMANVDALFFIAVHEVSNAQFRRFRPDHNSGVYEQVDLDGDDHPAVRVSWLDAVDYCNWLSARDGLTPFYVSTQDQGVQVDLEANGYRLPTEGEWSLVARNPSGERTLRFPWGDRMPPPPASGNYADRSAAHFLGRILAGYNDGFAGTAAVGSFPPNPLGLHDLGGNVAEWVHERYVPNPGTGRARADDFLGKVIGSHRVIRGSDWMSGDVIQLRLAFRRYGTEGLPDVGFRLARTP